MDRNIVYPGAIPLDTDLLTINRNAMIAFGFMIRATLGANTAVDGLGCTPSVPASMSIQIGAGSIAQISVVDTTNYGSLSANAGTPLMKMGINTAPQYFQLQSPTSPGTSVNYLVQAGLQESDQGLTVLPYYNSISPAQPFSGPTNSGTPQATSRTQIVQLQIKTGVPSSTGTQLTPTPDQGFSGLYVVAVSYGQTAITATNIAIAPTAPFIGWKLPQLSPGFGSGVQSFVSNGNFIVPPGVFQIEAELWGGGSGSFASMSGVASGGGSGGGYARKLIANLVPGQIIPVTVGAGGAAGNTAGVPAGSGGSSSLGQFVSATGGSLNYLSTPASAHFGATPPGTGINGDVNLTGSAGQSGILNQSGMGGGAPMGGNQNSGTTGVAGTTPGGGAAGAGTGANSTTSYNGAAGGGGLVVIRW
jgi:hypothetical protein